MAGTSIFDIIISKLRYRKKPCPIILLKVDQNLEISFYCAVLSFGLTVRQWIESGKEFSLDAKKIT